MSECCCSLGMEIIMAKKQAAAEATDTPAAAPAEAPAAEAKKPKDAKPEASASAAGKPAAQDPQEQSTKKKGRQPGSPPRRGKKLRNQIKNTEQKLSKEGIVPLKRAVQLLKQVKRAK